MHVIATDFGFVPLCNVLEVRFEVRDDVVVAAHVLLSNGTERMVREGVTARQIHQTLDGLWTATREEGHRRIHPISQTCEKPAWRDVQT